MLQLHVPVTAKIRNTCYDDKWHSLDVRGPLYWDSEQRIYDYPTAYSSKRGEYFHSISYNEAKREWIYMLNPVSGQGTTLEIHAYARSIPFWIGKAQGPYIIHGACKIKEDIDIWGAFWDLGMMEATSTLPNGEVYTFYGGFLFDRADHRVYYSDSAEGTGCGAPLSFSAFGLQQENLDMMILQSIKPPDCPVHHPVPFQHQGRINFPEIGEDYTFDNFVYSDDGKIPPTEHYLTGEYEAGEVDLTGTLHMLWSRWGISDSGTYWDPEGRHVWGRQLIHWQGVVTLHGDTMPVDAIGTGEFTRFKAGPSRIAADSQALMKSNLSQNYPNPFNSNTIIRYSLPSKTHIMLEIYNVSGQQVRTLVDEEQKSGTYQVLWNGKDNSGNKVASGVYFYELKIGDKFSQIKKLLLFR